jgi:hypothetical protein
MHLLLYFRYRFPWMIQNTSLENRAVTTKYLMSLRKTPYILPLSLSHSLSLSDGTTVQSGPRPLQLNASNSSYPQLSTSIFWHPTAPSRPDAQHLYTIYCIYPNTMLSLCVLFVCACTYTVFNWEWSWLTRGIPANLTQLRGMSITLALSRAVCAVQSRVSMDSDFNLISHKHNSLRHANCPTQKNCGNSVLDKGNNIINIHMYLYIAVLQPLSVLNRCHNRTILPYLCFKTDYSTTFEIC